MNLVRLLDSLPYSMGAVCRQRQKYIVKVQIMSSKKKEEEEEEEEEGILIIGCYSRCVVNILPQSQRRNEEISNTPIFQIT